MRRTTFLWLAAIGLILLALGSLASVLYTLSLFWAQANTGLMPPLMEYTPTYGGAMLMQDLPPENLYLPGPMLEYTIHALHEMYPGVNEIWNSRVKYPPWMYPPHFNLLVIPLAYMGYWWSYLAWNLATGAVYLTAMGKILPLRLAVPFALAMPPVFYNVLQGQTGFLTAGFIGLGLALVRRKPWLAGVFIGLASVKPHFGLLIPLALIAGGFWRPFVSAFLTVLACVVVSISLHGLAPWLALLESASANVQGFSYMYHLLTTVFSSAASLGVSLEMANVIQFVFLMAMATLVAWVWWRGQAHPETQGLQNAILCFATPLCLPIAYIYDLVLIAPASAWLALELWRAAGRWWEWTLLVLANLGLFSVVTIGLRFGVQIAPWFLLLLTALSLHRFLRALSMRHADPVGSLA